MTEQRMYFTIDAGATRTQNQWNTLRTGVKNKPFTLALRTAGDNENTPYNQLTTLRFSTNPPLRYLLCKAEEADADLAALLTVLNSECTRRGISTAQSARLKTQALIQAELQEAATDAGFGAFAALLIVTVVGFGARQTAIDQATTWYLANKAAWE